MFTIVAHRVFRESSRNMLQSKFLFLTGTCNVSILGVALWTSMITVALCPLNKNASLENQFHGGCAGRVFPEHRAKIQTQVEIERLPGRVSLSLHLFTVCCRVTILWQSNAFSRNGNYVALFSSLVTILWRMTGRIFLYDYTIVPVRGIKHSRSHLFNFSFFFLFFLFSSISFFPNALQIFERRDCTLPRGKSIRVEWAFAPPSRLLVVRRL